LIFHFSAAVATTSEYSKKVERCCLHPHATDICSGRPPTRTPTRPPTIKPTFKPTSNIKPNNKCGKRNENGVVGVRTVLEVDDAEFGEWPHVCAVLVKKIEQGTVSISWSHGSIFCFSLFLGAEGLLMWRVLDRGWGHLDSCALLK
jgi:hypothetical protein